MERDKEIARRFSELKGGNMIVAIDGPAGSGKSTIAKLISEKFEFFNLNSGEFYRAFAYEHLQKGRSLESKSDIDESLKDIVLSLNGDDILINGKKVEKTLLHTKDVDNASSILSVEIPVRMRVNELLRESIKGRNIVCEGRDITSVVFPNAELKIYLDANLEERAKRRATERGENQGEIALSLKERDERDINKTFGGLKKVEDATVIDTTYLTINEVFNKISTMVEMCL